MMYKISEVKPKVMYNRKALTIADFYKAYVDEEGVKIIKHLPYPLFRAILEDYFKHVRYSILEDGETFKLPYNLGIWFIGKRKPATWNPNYLRVDYNLSKKYGKKIYHLNEHTNGFNYKYVWSKKRSNHGKIKAYEFVPTRANKRRLCSILKSGERDYISY